MQNGPVGIASNNGRFILANLGANSAPVLSTATQIFPSNLPTVGYYALEVETVSLSQEDADCKVFGNVTITSCIKSIA